MVLISGIYSKCSSHVHTHTHRVIDHLGAGQFGSVVKAKWEFPGGEMEVAVKMMRPSALEGAKVNFLREAAVMGQFFHPNVIRLHGVVTVGDPVRSSQSNVATR